MFDCQRPIDDCENGVIGEFVQICRYFQLHLSYFRVCGQTDEQRWMPLIRYVNRLRVMLLLQNQMNREMTVHVTWQPSVQRISVLYRIQFDIFQLDSQ